MSKWYPTSVCEKVENSDFPNCYKFTIKEPNPVLWFLYRQYVGAFETLGFVSCSECEKWFQKDKMYCQDYCEKCHEYNFCECGQRLEDSYGSPGDGFCIKCR